jgi:hypothetical protein
MPPHDREAPGLGNPGTTPISTSSQQVDLKPILAEPADNTRGVVR